MKPLFVVTVLFLIVGCASPEKKLSREGTTELKLRHQQCLDYLRAERKDFEFKFGPPLAMAIQGDPRKERIEEKERLERELLRRWKAGDAEAYLPIFGGQR